MRVAGGIYHVRLTGLDEGPAVGPAATPATGPAAAPAPGAVGPTPDASGCIRASLRGRLKRTDARVVSVGDLVELERAGEELSIAHLLPRQSALARHGVSKRREQVIVANVDQVAVVVSVAAPAPDLLMVDRLLALAALNRIDALLVVNKIDLSASPPDADELDRYAALGVETLRTSAESGLGLDALAGRLAGSVTVFSGQSGVGKSRLLNALVPGLDLRVGEISERRGRGRHTTVASALYPYPTGGYVADTPGLQYLALWDVDPAQLQRGFVEIAEAARECRFADCRHREEPSCAVATAVRSGAIQHRRLDSYLRLLDEAERPR